MSGSVRMQIYDVFRAEQTSVIEVAGLEVERVECSLAAIGGIVVAAGDIGFEAESRLTHRLQSVAGIETGRPSEDGIISEAAHLQDFLGVPVPVLPISELARAKRMPVFLARTGSVRAVF